MFIEALKRAGQDLTREKLIAALESLYDFETGATPRLTFGPNRRIGAMGSYIVTIDAVEKQFVDAGRWVDANQCGAIGERPRRLMSLRGPLDQQLMM